MELIYLQLSQMTYVQVKQTEFYTDWEMGTSGLVKNGVEIPKNSFAMKLKCLVEAEGCTGYFVEVVRELDLKKR